MAADKPAANLDTNGGVVTARDRDDTGFDVSSPDGAPEDLAGTPPQFRVTSITFNSPNPFTLKENDGGHHATVWQGITGGPPPTYVVDTEKQVKIRQVVLQQSWSADNFPIYVHGDLVGPKGGGGGQGKRPEPMHWAAGITGRGFVFLPDKVVKTGYAINTTTSPGTKEPLTKVAVLFCSNRGDANDVAISLSGADAPFAEIGTVTRDGEAGTVTIEVRGKTASTTTSVTTLIAQRPVGTTVASVPVRVVIPQTRQHQLGQALRANTSEVIPGQGTNLGTLAGRFVLINVSDQFGEVLDSVYDGNGVVEERFENMLSEPAEQAPIGPDVWTPIRVPDASFKNGVKLDRTGFHLRTPVGVELTPDQQAGWKTFTWAYEGHSTVYSILAGVGLFGKHTLGLEGDMHVRVHGHPVGPDVRRVMMVNIGEPINYSVSH